MCCAQNGGKNQIILSGSIFEIVHNILTHICAKFGACITKCTIKTLNSWTKMMNKGVSETNILNSVKTFEEYSDAIHDMSLSYNKEDSGKYGQICQTFGSIHRSRC